MAKVLESRRARGQNPLDGAPADLTWRCLRMLEIGEQIRRVLSRVDAVGLEEIQATCTARFTWAVSARERRLTSTALPALKMAPR